MIVLDSSAVIEWLLSLPRTDAVAARIMDADSLHAPALIDVEVAQVVRRYTSRGEIDTPSGERALGMLADLDVRRYTHESLLPAIWRLRHNFSAYDASYVVLAGVLGVPILTLDTRTARAARRLSVAVDLVE